jgi:hypothetical protein
MSGTPRRPSTPVKKITTTTMVHPFLHHFTSFRIGFIHDIPEEDTVSFLLGSQFHKVHRLRLPLLLATLTLEETEASHFNSIVIARMIINSNKEP